MARLLFAADDGSTGYEFYAADGTTITPLGDINPNQASAYQFTDEAAVIGGTAYFLAEDAVAGEELYVSDGTPGGTFRLADIFFGPSDSDPSDFAVLGGSVLFAADTGEDGRELWITDGTEAGTVQVRDINSGSGDSDPESLATLGSIVLFSAENGADGEELWVSDGTEIGTRQLLDINAGTQDSRPFLFPELEAELGGSRFFTAFQQDAGRELWLTDGTQGGTGRVLDIYRGDADIAGNTSTDESIAPGETVISERAFDGDTDWFRTQLTAGTTYTITLKGDPSNVGTLSDPLVRLFDANSVQVASDDDGGAGLESELVFTPATSGTYYISAEGFSSAQVGTYQLGLSDGGGFGTPRDLNRDPASSSPDDFQAYDGRMFFTAFEPVNGRELWVSDGTSGGTQLLIDIEDGTRGSSPRDLTLFGESLIFSAETSAEGRELWISGGLGSNTQLLSNIFSGGGSSDPAEFTQLGERLLFAATDNAVGRELFVTDGTASGTRLLVDINEGAGNANPDDFQVVGDKVFFSAFSNDFGRELWMTDGTAAGTMRVTDLDPGSDGSDPRLLAVLDEGGGGQAPDFTEGDDTIDFASLSDFLAADRALEAEGESFDAGPGDDVVVLGADRDDFTETENADGTVTVSFEDENGAQQSVTVEGVETIRFNDGDYLYDLLDIGGSQDDLEYTYRLYKSSVARTPEEAGLEFWFGELTAGLITRDGLAEAFVQSTEFRSKFPQNVDDETFVTSYYTNILGRDPDPDGLEFWVDSFQAGVSRSQLLKEFAISPEFVRQNEDNYDDGVFVLRGEPLPEAAPEQSALALEESLDLG